METINEFLLGALENVLGKGYRKSKGNYSFHCPFCHHRKPKLEINLDSSSPYFGCWECWVCGTKGRSIKSLLSHLKLTRLEAEQILQFVQSGDTSEYRYQYSFVRLPEEYKPLALASFASYEAKRVREYLYARGLTDDDFLKYDIGYCTSGKFQDRVIIPSYDENNCLNYFVARSLDPNAFFKYMNPDNVSRDVILFENLVNWNEPVILCEGVFDAFAIRRNVIPLLGKQILPSLMKKIITSPFEDLYIVLDRDAIKQALNHCETFLNVGKRVFFIEPSEKDPSEEGFIEFTQQVQKAKPLTFQDLVRYRLEL